MYGYACNGRPPARSNVDTNDDEDLLIASVTLKCFPHKKSAWEK